MSERLETLPEIEREAAESELRKTLSEETDRLMTNAEVDEVIVFIGIRIIFNISLYLIR
jgi:hypothetical protein